jgi:hypothetical protein
LRVMPMRLRSRESCDHDKHTRRPSSPSSTIVFTLTAALRLRLRWCETTHTEVNEGGGRRTSFGENGQGERAQPLHRRVSRVREPQERPNELPLHSLRD